MSTLVPSALAKWTPVRNYSQGRVNRPPRGVVLHHTEGSNASGAIAWMNNPAAQVSAHFVIDYDGTAYQTVDLDNRAWCQSAGNPDWISFECVGFHTEALTTHQVIRVCLLLAWLHEHYGFPLTPTDDPINGRGLGWHGMGGNAWGGHPGCPGALTEAQRGALCAGAQWVVGAAGFR
jgi:hypothetical protein